uniref:Uncharacterized protein n=1 Tax=Romanomermis culicivorax TaxID=13658 RepID=A0A915JB01_ROMCU
MAKLVRVQWLTNNHRSDGRINEIPRYTIKNSDPLKAGMTIDACFGKKVLKAKMLRFIGSTAKPDYMPPWDEEIPITTVDIPGVSNKNDCQMNNINNNDQLINDDYILQPL